MTITRGQVADLQPGDVVELCFPSGSTVRGPLTTDESYGPGLGIPDVGWTVRDRDGNPGWFSSLGATLTVVSRAPRPLYVNHPRTEPVPGDVVRDELGNKMALFICTQEEEEVWWVDTAADWISPAEMREKRLRLLVDGSTGETTP